MAKQLQFTIVGTGGVEVGATLLTPEMTAEAQSWGEDTTKFNSMTWRYAGASKYSECTVLLMKRDYDRVFPNETLANSVSVKIGNFAGADAEKFYCDQMYLMEPRPIHIFTLPANVDAIYAVKLVDARYFGRTLTANHAYNITTTNDRTVFYTQSKNGGSNYTWSDIVTGLLGDLGISGDTSNSLTFTGTPTDFLIDYENAAEMLDRVLATLGAVFIANSLPVAGKRYQIVNAIDLATNANKHNDALLSERMAGGTIYSPGTADGRALLNAIMPATVTVKFPRQIPTDAADTTASANPPAMRQFKTLTSTSGKPTGVTGRSSLGVTIGDDLWAVGPIGSETNLTDLQTRADAVATAYYQRWKAQRSNVRLRGIANSGPFAGKLVIRYSIDGACTDIHLDTCFAPYSETEFERVYALGGLQTFRTFDGALVISGNLKGGAHVVRVDSAASAGGVYDGVIMDSPTADAPAGVNLAEADIGVEGEACIIENMMEVGQATHDLVDAANTYQFYFLGSLRRTNSDGTKVIAINGFFIGCTETGNSIDGGGA